MIVGGAGTLLGPALGGAALVLLHFTIGQSIRYWNLVLGLIYLGVVFLAPNGIVQAVRQLAVKRRPTAPKTQPGRSAVMTPVLEASMESALRLGAFGRCRTSRFRSSVASGGRSSARTVPGKATLFNLIAGQLRPNRGRVLLQGQDLTRQPPYERARAGLSRTFQISRLFRGLTVRQSLALAVEGRDGVTWASFRRRIAEPAMRERIEGLLEMWVLNDQADAPIEALSHGNQRLLDVAMALANEPQVLLLDEPTAGLSASERDLAIRN